MECVEQSGAHEPATSMQTLLLLQAEAVRFAHGGPQTPAAGFHMHPLSKMQLERTDP